MPDAEPNCADGQQESENANPGSDGIAAHSTTSISALESKGPIPASWSLSKLRRGLPAILQAMIGDARQYRSRGSLISGKAGFRGRRLASQSKATAIRGDSPDHPVLAVRSTLRRLTSARGNCTGKFQKCSALALPPRSRLQDIQSTL